MKESNKSLYITRNVGIKKLHKIRSKSRQSLTRVFSMMTLKRAHTALPSRTRPWQTYGYQLTGDQWAFNTLDWSDHSADPTAKQFEDLKAMRTCLMMNEMLDASLLSLQARLQGHDEDSPTFRDVLHQSDDEHDKWFDAMDKELSGLHDKDCFQGRESGRRGRMQDSALHVGTQEEKGPTEVC